MTTGETGDSRNVDGNPGAVWVSAPACVFREEEAQQTHGEAFRRAIHASRKWSVHADHAPRNHHTRRKCWIGGVWYNAQDLELPGQDLVRRRRSPARRPPTEPSPSMCQSCPQTRQSSSGDAD